MKRLNRAAPIRTEILACAQTTCPYCGGPTYLQYRNQRTVVTLEGSVRLVLKVRRCETPECPHYHKPYRPEAEGRFALFQHEFGLDVIAQIGTWRYRDHRSVPDIHALLRSLDLPISERSVTNLLNRYDELVALSTLDVARLKRLTAPAGRVILAIDGLQPDVGNEVLWVIRDTLSSQILLVRALLSSSQDDLANLLEEVQAALDVPVAAVVSDGQRSMRNAVARVFPDTPHQLCHFHYLREAATPVFEADRHAKKELKKRVRNIRPLERAMEGRTDAEATLVHGYALAVRSALGDDGQAPLDAPGLRLRERLAAIHDSVERVKQKGDVESSSGD